MTILLTEAQRCLVQWAIQGVSAVPDPDDLLSRLEHQTPDMRDSAIEHALAQGKARQATLRFPRGQINAARTIPLTAGRDRSSAS